MKTQPLQQVILSNSISIGKNTNPDQVSHLVQKLSKTWIINMNIKYKHFINIKYKILKHKKKISRSRTSKNIIRLDIQSIIYKRRN